MKHVKTGKCVNDTAQIQSNASWGSLSYLNLSNNCLDPAAQFRFRDNATMLNLKRQGYLTICKKRALPEMFYVYVPSSPPNITESACADHRAIKQTPWGGLSGSNDSVTRCADPQMYIETTNCGYTENRRFNFGKFL